MIVVRDLLATVSIREWGLASKSTLDSLLTHHGVDKTPVVVA